MKSNKKLWWLIIGLFISTSLLISAWAGETGTVIRADNLKSESNASAPLTDKIGLGDQVEIVDRQGGWLKVKLRQTTGWVRLLSVKLGAATSSSGNVSDVLKLATGQAGSGQVTAVAGIRGLSEEELKAAKFNAQELALLKSSSITSEDAQKFASNGGLQAQPMEYLPAPARPEANKSPAGFLK